MEYLLMLPICAYVYRYVCIHAWNHNSCEDRTLCCYNMRAPIDDSYRPLKYSSSALAVFQNSTVPTQVDSGFWNWFNSGFTDLIKLKVFDGIRFRFYWINFTQGFWLDSNQFYRPNSTHNFWWNLTQVLSDSIWITFKAIGFDSIHIIRVTFQPIFWKYHIGEGVFEITHTRLR